VGEDTTPPIAVLKVKLDELQVDSKMFTVSPIDLLIPDTTTGQSAVKFRSVLQTMPFRIQKQAVLLT
jgi:hypothetical protein